jgi:hypothetical protein
MLDLISLFCFEGNGSPSSIVGKTNFQTMGSVKACSSSSIEMKKSSRRRKSVHMAPHRLFKTSSANPLRGKKKKAAKDFCFRS